MDKFDKIARKMFVKYAKVIESWWVEESCYDYKTGGRYNVYFVELKRPYGILEGKDYYTEHFMGRGDELESYFKDVERIDPKVWDNNGMVN